MYGGVARGTQHHALSKWRHPTIFTSSRVVNGDRLGRLSSFKILAEFDIIISLFATSQNLYKWDLLWTVMADVRTWS